MDCKEFVERFTDYYDGVARSEDSSEMETHLASCDSCSRYRNVLEQGSSLLRSLPEPELRDDFAPRLEHRLYHVQDERAFEPAASGAPALTVLGIAILLTAMAWTPLLRDSAPQVELAPIIVDRAPSLQRAPAASGGLSTFGVQRPASLEVGLWEDARLYEYSSVGRRYRDGAQPTQVSLGSNR